MIQEPNFFPCGFCAAAGVMKAGNSDKPATRQSVAIRGKRVQGMMMRLRPYGRSMVRRLMRRSLREFGTVLPVADLTAPRVVGSNRPVLGWTG